MKTTLSWLAAALVSGWLAGLADAGNPPAVAYPGCCPYPVRIAPRAPDMCGPGFYAANCNGVYGPNYCVYPPFPPVGNMPPTNLGGGRTFQTHPFARRPRDYFMLDY